MAKNESAPAVRVKRPKTAKQLEQKAKNIAAYNARNAQIARDRETVAYARKVLKLEGTDKELLAMVKEIEAKAAQLKIENEAISYVENIIAIPRVGDIVSRWLGDRLKEMPKVELRLLVSNFMNRAKNADLLREAYPYLVYHEVQLKAA